LIHIHYQLAKVAHDNPNSITQFLKYIASFSHLTILN